MRRGQSEKRTRKYEPKLGNGLTRVVRLLNRLAPSGHLIESRRENGTPEITIGYRGQEEPLLFKPLLDVNLVTKTAGFRFIPEKLPGEPYSSLLPIIPRVLRKHGFTYRLDATKEDILHHHPELKDLTGGMTSAGLVGSFEMRYGPSAESIELVFLSNEKQNDLLTSLPAAELFHDKTAWVAPFYRGGSRTHAPTWRDAPLYAQKKLATVITAAGYVVTNDPIR